MATWPKSENARTIFPARAAWEQVLAYRIQSFGADHWKVTNARLDLDKARRLERTRPSPKELAEADALMRESVNLIKAGKYQDAVAAGNQAT